jgi:hypothetical protein
MAAKCVAWRRTWLREWHEGYSFDGGQAKHRLDGHGQIMIGSAIVDEHLPGR